MTFKRNAAGVQTDIATKAERRSSGVWVPVDIIKRRLTGAWTVAWQRINIAANAVSHSVGVGTATAGYRLNTSGIAEGREGASYSTLETWLAFGTASNYECRATVVFGTLTSGTSGAWLSLGSSQEWSITQVGVGTNTCEITIEIRNASTLVVLDSATITLEADRF